MGIAPYVYYYVKGVFVKYGVSFETGIELRPTIQTFLGFGAYLGSFAIWAYLGRRYYGNVFRRALMLTPSDEVETAAVWAARCFLIGGCVFAAALTFVGVDWQLAVLYTFLVIILYMGMCRVLAESGAFNLDPLWYPCVIVAGTLGYHAVDPTTFLVLMLATSVLALEPVQRLAPYMITSLKVLDLRRLRVGTPALACMLAAVVCLVIAVATTLYFQYDLGVRRDDHWAVQRVAKFPFKQTVRVQQRLRAQGQEDQVSQVRSWARFTRLSARPSHLIAMAAGVALVLLFGALRLWLPRFPFHPILFLVWTTWISMVMGFSFLIGWFIKVVVTRYGGARSYQTFKPLMLGLIAGELTGMFIRPLVNLIRFLMTTVTGPI